MSWDFNLISPAYAQAQPGGMEAAIGNIFFLFLLFGVLYFFVLRPHRKEQDALKATIENLQRGDSVVIANGLLGKIHRIDDDIIVVDVGEVEVAPRTMRPVRIRARKMSVTAVTAKSGAPALPDDGEKK